MAPPIRITRSVGSTSVRQVGGLNGAAISYPFARGKTKELIRPISRLTRVSEANLRRFARSVPATAAITRITNGVLALPWSVIPPIGQDKSDLHQKMAQILTNAMKHPNREFNGGFRHLIAGMIDDALVLNRTFVERQPGDNIQIQPFWLWAANAATTQYNSAWNSTITGITPKFWDTSRATQSRSSNYIPIMEENMFAIVYNVNTHELIPPSPMETAYGFIEAWLGLSDYQQSTTSRASQEWLLDIGEASEDELKAFREYWQAEVVEGQKTPILAGKGLVKVTKLGATGDGGLYPRYCDYLLKIISLAFSLTSRDSNITEHDNRATAGVSADSTFDFAIRPMALMIQEALSEEAVGYYVPGFTFKFDLKRPRSEAELLAESREDFKQGVTTRNEARKLRGLDPIDEPAPPKDENIN